ncbi:pilS cassette [Neisseria mucosa]|nr:pilS cassette [Neisseria mucosa]
MGRLAPSFPRRRESIVRPKKPLFEKQFPNFKNGFPPARE